MKYNPEQTISYINEGYNKIVQIESHKRLKEILLDKSITELEDKIAHYDNLYNQIKDKGIHHSKSKVIVEIYEKQTCKAFLYEGDEKYYKIASLNKHPPLIFGKISYTELESSGKCKCFISSKHEFPSLSKHEAMFDGELYEFTHRYRQFKYEYIYFSLCAYTNCSVEMRLRFLTESEYIEKTSKKLFSQHSTSGIKIKLSETLQLLHNSKLYRDSLSKLSKSIAQKKKSISKNSSNYVQLNIGRSLTYRNYSLENIRKEAKKESKRIFNAQLKKRIKSSFEMAEVIIKNDKSQIRTERKHYIDIVKTSILSKVHMQKQYYIFFQIITYLKYISKETKISIKESTKILSRKYSLNKIVFFLIKLSNMKSGVSQIRRVFPASVLFTGIHFTFHKAIEDNCEKIVFSCIYTHQRYLMLQNGLHHFFNAASIIHSGIHHFISKQEARTICIMHYWDLIGQTYMDIASSHQKHGISAKLYKQGLAYKSLPFAEKRNACRRFVKIQFIEYERNLTAHTNGSIEILSALLNKIKAKHSQINPNLYNDAIQEQITNLRIHIKTSMGIKVTHKKNASDNLLDRKRSRILSSDTNIIEFELIRPYEEFENYMQLNIDTAKLHVKKHKKSNYLFYIILEFT